MGDEVVQVALEVESLLLPRRRRLGALATVSALAGARATVGALADALAGALAAAARLGR